MRHAHSRVILRLLSVFGAPQSGKTSIVQRVLSAVITRASCNGFTCIRFFEKRVRVVCSMSLCVCVCVSAGVCLCVMHLQDFEALESTLDNFPVVEKTLVCSPAVHLPRDSVAAVNST